MASTPVQARIDADAPDLRQGRAPMAGASFCCSSPSIGRPGSTAPCGPTWSPRPIEAWAERPFKTNPSGPPPAGR